MKKLHFIILAVALMFGLALPVVSVGAADVLDPVCTPETADATLCRDDSNPSDLNCNSVFGECGIITKAARLVSIVVGVASVILIIIGSIQYILSSGDPTNVQNAKNTILYAIIGLVIALIARGIITFVLVRI